jgi:biotin synthase
VKRYFLGGSPVLASAEYAWRKGFGSIVLQSGERKDKAFINHVTDLIRQIKSLSNNELGITLSCGDQSEETYRQWMDAGAHRYLLRIESSNEDLYYKIHPRDKNHDFKERLNALKTLQRLGYQTGTGVMIGLPGQTIEHLADDLLFMKEFGIDMVGMGPYIPHPDTPMYDLKDTLPDEEKRLDLSLKMIALLRLIMKDVNIAASTALQTLDAYGRVKAIASGANVFMPNLTPAEQACNYSIYAGKPVSTDMAEHVMIEFEENIEDLGFIMNYREWGDSRHFFRRIANN